MIGAHADVCVHSDRKLLGAAEPEWQLGAKDQRVIREKFVSEPVTKGQAIKIVLAAENEIVELRQEIIQARFGIEASEIEAVVFAIVKNLLPGVQVGVERFRDPRLVINGGYWRDHNIADFTTACQRHVRRVKNRRCERKSERLILRNAFQNFLLADIFIVRARRRVPIFNTFRRHSRNSTDWGFKLILGKLRSIGVRGRLPERLAAGCEP